MTAISFSGLATGLNSASIISQLMQLQRQPETLMQAQQTTDQNKINEFGKIESALTNLQSVMTGFSTVDGFSSMQAAASDSTAVGVTATGSASPGTHSVSVLSLASTERQVSTGVSSSTALVYSTGSFTISDGVAADTPVTVNIAEGQNSLQGIATAINSSGANVTASVVNDGTNYRLVVNGKDTNSYTLDFSGLSTDPAGGTGALTPTMLGSGDPTYQAPAQAHLVVDGIDMYKDSNTVTDAIQGVTLNLQSVANTTVTVTSDTDTVTQKINSFVSAYNSAISLVNSESVYNTTTNTAGVLAGDMTVQQIKSQLQSLLTTSVPGGSSVNSLADLGVTINQQDGTLSLNSSTLSSALSNNYNDVVNLFTHNGNSAVTLPASQYGLAQNFNLTIGTMVNPYVAGSSTSGSIEIAKQGLNQNISDLTDHINALEQRLTQTQTNMQNQFNALEVTVSQLQSQGNMLLAYLGDSTTSSGSSSTGSSSTSSSSSSLG